eukprot:3845-Pelagomonas_calceolata.AAC.2
MHGFTIISIEAHEGRAIPFLLHSSAQGLYTSLPRLLLVSQANASGCILMAHHVIVQDGLQKAGAALAGSRVRCINVLHRCAECHAHVSGEPASSKMHSHTCACTPAAHSEPGDHSLQPPVGLDRSELSALLAAAAAAAAVAAAVAAVAAAAVGAENWRRMLLTWLQIGGATGTSGQYTHM